MDRAPRVSVLMTVHNAERYVRAAIDSIVNQTFADWELIVVENGSTDSSPAILKAYTDPRIAVTWLPSDIGRTPALRHGFDLVRGEYVAVLDADDRSDPNRLAKQVAYLDVHRDVVMVGSWALHIDEDGASFDRWSPSTAPGTLNESIGWGNVFVHSSVMYRASVASDMGGYPAELPCTQDFGLWLRLVQRGRLAMIGEYLCEQRVLSHSLSRNKQYRADFTRDILALLGYARTHVDLGKDGLRRNRERTSIETLKYGIALLNSRHVVGGCRAIGRAVFGNPAAFLRKDVLLKYLSK